jgi:hypothetical protein
MEGFGDKISIGTFFRKRLVYVQISFKSRCEKDSRGTLVPGVKSPSSKMTNPFFYAYWERIDELPICVQLPALPPK